jgi:hypothetical protein
VANVVADVLSRIAYTQSAPAAAVDLLNVLELPISASKEWLDDVRKGYMQDVMFEPIVKLLQGGEVGRDIKISKDKKTRWTRKRAKAYFHQDGLLFHYVSGGILYIPYSQRQDVIREVHDTILGGGHVSIELTAVAVSSRYNWSRLIDSVANWIAGCDVC